MSYLALARKWRPRSFADVLGQSPVVQALTHSLDGDKLHPAILLTGTRGVGKTTLARIVAKGLNCETGVTPTPCGECSSCKEVDEGRFVDLLEIDAASRTRVEDTRDMLDNVQYAPVRGRYKVYLIDEVHMLSGHSFNALLKTLEEPPPHVKFILATTDPQKLPITVLSRCLQFHLRRLPTGLIRDLLAQVLENEKVESEPAALLELARSAEGSMRDGLSLMDQALVFSGGKKITAAQIEEMLGTGGRRRLLELLQAVADDDSDALLGHLQQLEELAPDYSALISDMAATVQRMAIIKMLPKAKDEDDAEKLLALAEKIPAEDLQLYYQIAVHGRRDLPYAPDARLGFEMTVLRMMTFRPQAVGEGNSGNGTPSAQGNSNNAGGSQAGNSGQSAAAVAATPNYASTRSVSWEREVEMIDVNGIERALARHSTVIDDSGDYIRLALPSTHQHMLDTPRQQALAAALSVRRGKKVHIEFELSGGLADEAPAELDRQRAIARQRQAEQDFANHPVVKALQDKFSASIRPGSVNLKQSAATEAAGSDNALKTQNPIHKAGHGVH